MDNSTKPLLATCLTEAQASNLEAIRWLYFGPRCSGRTFLVAAATIQHALENPNVSIALRDHSSDFGSVENLMNQIELILSKFDLPGKFLVNRMGRTLMYCE